MKFFGNLQSDPENLLFKQTIDPFVVKRWTNLYQFLFFIKLPRYNNLQKNLNIGKYSILLSIFILTHFSLR
jgi:hypothetical protein